MVEAAREWGTREIAAAARESADRGGRRATAMGSGLEWRGLEVAGEVRRVEAIAERGGGARVDGADGDF